MLYKEFFGTCVSNPFDTEDELEEIKNSGISISEEEFLKNINKDTEEVRKLLKDIKQYPNDYEFYKTPDGEIYFFSHSAIEYFFK